MTEPKIEIRGPQSEIILTIRGRERPEAEDYRDGNWVDTFVRARTPGFEAYFSDTLHLSELSQFRDQLRQMWETLTGEATLKATKEFLLVTGAMDALGHLRWVSQLAADRCWVVQLGEERGGGGRLQFEFGSDQSYLPALLQQLDDTLAQYPIRGQRPMDGAAPAARRITCLSVGTYEGALTRARKYELAALDEPRGLVQVCGDNGRTRWFLAHCFDLAGGPAPVLASWRFDDEVRDERNDRDETDNLVHLSFALDDGSRRWCIFATPDYLTGLLGPRSEPSRWGGAAEPGIWGGHIIVIRDLRAETVDWMLRYLDQQGELVEHSRLVEEQQ